MYESTTDRPAEVLNWIKGKFTKHPEAWVKGMYFGKSTEGLDTRPCCLIGGVARWLSEVVHTLPGGAGTFVLTAERSKVIRLLAEAADELYPSRVVKKDTCRDGSPQYGAWVRTFNDNEETTLADVMKVIDLAISKANNS